MLSPTFVSVEKDKGDKEDKEDKEDKGDKEVILATSHQPLATYGTKSSILVNSRHRR
ncbi:hypothetical protein [Chroococcidiopsis sp. CCALA 051]|uniref:hypothetical protein n=1 Tax=Chroococcidiopsis sp. CCALA 051 TaxID=869949 RepID=UPI0013050249|nr:hypothetical protein [Chroococcidiopsis sp. CCALA 051]